MVYKFIEPHLTGPKAPPSHDFCIPPTPLEHRHDHTSPIMSAHRCTGVERSIEAAGEVSRKRNRHCSLRAARGCCFCGNACTY